MDLYVLSTVSLSSTGSKQTKKQGNDEESYSLLGSRQ